VRGGVAGGCGSVRCAAIWRAGDLANNQVPDSIPPIAVRLGGVLIYLGSDQFRLSRH
jgi:hypothetical protein